MSQDWFSEGNIVETLARSLERQGWQVALTGNADQGLGLAALRDERELLVEVKGFPSAPSARGPRAGQPKPTRMASQARQWYAYALLGVTLKRHAHPDAGIALALPDHRTYRSLIGRTARSLRALEVGVLLVSASGDIETVIEPAVAEPSGRER